MRKIRFKQSIAFVVFLLAVAAMDSRLNITAGVLAILSSIYLLTSSRKEQRDVPVSYTHLVYSTLYFEPDVRLTMQIHNHQV